MRLDVIGVCLCSFLIAAPSFADKVDESTDGSGDMYDEAGDCPPVDYKFDQRSGGAIPDNDPLGERFGPMNIPDDGSVFEDIILELDINHTWVGDLSVCLSYDRECDSVMDVGPVCVLARAGADGADCDATGFGCSADLIGKYLFSDEIPDAVEDICDGVGSIGEGCYGIDSYSSLLLDAFDGEAKGGCFNLFITDCAAGDTGTLLSWSVYQKNSEDPTPIEEATWTELKDVYAD